MPSVIWDGVPPSMPPHGIQVFTVAKGSTVFARLLDGWQGVWLHWLPELGPRGRSLPCEGAGCPYCPDPAVKWYGYAPALVWRKTSEQAGSDWHPNALELTEHATRQLRELPALRGLVVQLRREAKRNGRLECTPLENAKLRSGKQLAPLPPAFDVRPILERMWGHYQRAAALAAAEASAAANGHGQNGVVLFTPPEEPRKPKRKKRGQK